MSDLSNDRSWEEPFDIDAFLNAPDAKVFHPDETLTVDLTDEEWASFDQAIREGRKTGNQHEQAGGKDSG